MLKTAPYELLVSLDITVGHDLIGIKVIDECWETTDQLRWEHLDILSTEH